MTAGITNIVLGGFNHLQLPLVATCSQNVEQPCSVFPQMLVRRGIYTIYVPMIWTEDLGTLQ